MVIVFMTPVHGKLKTQQPLVTKEGGVLGEGQRAALTVTVTAQYKIENALATVDAT